MISTSAYFCCLFLFIHSDLLYLHKRGTQLENLEHKDSLSNLCITLCIIGLNHSPNFTKQIDTDKNFFQIFTADMEMTDEILLDMKSENNNKTK